MERGNVSLELELGRAPGLLMRVAEGLGAMFYIHDPAKSTFHHVTDVPKYFRNAWPYFLAFIIVENVILWLQRKPTARLNDSITSISHGIFLECGRLLFRGSEAAAYIYLFENFRVLDLNWDSHITWYLAAIGVDFCYYWVHRANHEVCILWAQHQVHHSSEEFNLTVGLRQSILQSWCSFIFYLPLALIIPPSHFLVHQQLNLLYQFWIHTRAVESLGPLEWVLNTPKHHRVHHGCNAYCIDCNYGGLLIVWDRLFGTFQEEQPKQDIVYGLVFNQPSFNPFFLQVFYNDFVYNKWRSMEGWTNKLSALIKGPSWEPGGPWTAPFEKRLDIRTRDKYDVILPAWCNAYLILHFLAVVLIFHQLAQHHLTMHTGTAVAVVGYIIFSLTAIGMLLDGREYAGVLEAARCLTSLVLAHRLPALSLGDLIPGLMQGFFAASAALWLVQGLMQSAKKKKL